MHLTQLLASAAVVGSVLAHVPGVVHDTPFAKREIVARAECSRNNLLRALVRFQGSGTEEFCQSFLGGLGGGAATVTVPGGTATVNATITTAPEVVTETVTEVGTVTAPARLRRQAAISVPAGISQYANDTRLSSGCACLLYSTSVVPVGATLTVTGPAEATATATETVTAGGTTTFETITVPRPSDSEPTEEPTGEPTSTDPSPTSSEPPATPTGCVTGEPLIGCVFGSSIISADLITDEAECPALCAAIEDCVAYQTGRDESGVIAYCETLNVSAAEAFDEAGSEESAEYCAAFTIYDYTCPTIGTPARFRRF